MRRFFLLLLAAAVFITLPAAAESTAEQADPEPSDPAAHPRVSILVPGGSGSMVLPLGVVAPPMFCLASEDDRCGAVRRIVHSQPCTNLEDCHAFFELHELLGENDGIRLLGGGAQPQGTKVLHVQPFVLDMESAADAATDDED